MVNSLRRNDACRLRHRGQGRLVIFGMQLVRSLLVLTCLQIKGSGLVLTAKQLARRAKKTPALWSKWADKSKIQSLCMRLKYEKALDLKACDRNLVESLGCDSDERFALCYNPSSPDFDSWGHDWHVVVVATKQVKVRLWACLRCRIFHKDVAGYGEQQAL